MKKRFILVLWGCLFSTVFVWGQDAIYRVNPVDTIFCQIQEIGEDLVRYTTSAYGHDVVFSIDRNNIVKIVFTDGKELTFAHTMFGAEHYETQRKNALKLSFFSIFYNAPLFSYERSLKPGQSVEFGVGIIGAGYDAPGEKARGVIVKAGYKFMTSPTYYNRKLRYSHILKGGYVKPEISLVTYTREKDIGCYDYEEFFYKTKRDRTTLFSISIIGGKQWIFNDVFLIDLFIGTGYAVGHLADEGNGWHYNYTGAVDDMPLIFTGGLKVGFLFGSRSRNFRK